MLDKKTETMMDYLSVAYSDEEVKKIPELKELLFHYAKDLEKTKNPSMLAARLCGEIPLYYLNHQKDCPKALMQLYLQLAHDAAKYKGIAHSCMLLPIWF